MMKELLFGLFWMTFAGISFGFGIIHLLRFVVSR